MDWIADNAPWLFSGAAVAIPLALVSWYVSRRRSGKAQWQRQKGGAGSTNIQAGRDITVHGSGPDGDRNGST